MSELARCLNWLRIVLIVVTLSVLWIPERRAAWVVKTPYGDYVYWTDTNYQTARSGLKSDWPNYAAEPWRLMLIFKPRRTLDAESMSRMTHEYFGGCGCHRFFAPEKLAERIEKANK